MLLLDVCVDARSRAACGRRPEPLAPAQKGIEEFSLGCEAVFSRLTVGPQTCALQVLVPVLEPGTVVSCRRRACPP